MLSTMPGALVTVVLADLRIEGDELDGLVARLPDAAWARPTPAEGWTIAHQISHLAWTVSTVGADADRWLDIAQAYAGPPSPGRKPGQFG